MLDSWVDNGMPELAEYVYQTWIESGEWRWFEGRLKINDNYSNYNFCRCISFHFE